MVGDYHTLGAKVPTGNGVRIETGDHVDGTTLNQVDGALNRGWHIDLDTRISSAAVTWDYFVAQIVRGKAAVLQGGYDPIRRSRFAGSTVFRGNHAIAVMPGFVGMDPLADGRRAGIYKYHREAYPQSLLKSFASQLVVNPATGGKSGTHVWCSFSRDNTTTWHAEVTGAVYFYRVRVEADGDWTILGRDAKRTAGIKASCTPPHIARPAPGVAIPIKSLVRLTSGVHSGAYIQASFATEVP
jgi:hypothetical protein